MTTLNATQVGLEVWASDASNLVATQVGLEVWASDASKLVATQVGLEVWASAVTTGTALTATQVGLEVWAYVAPAPSGRYYAKFDGGFSGGLNSPALGGFQ